jgi:hypothetical protein
MKTVFVVNVDSFSDVITNSSTDIFACKSSKSIDAIKKLLDAIAGAAGESAGLTVEECTIQEFWNRTSDYCCFDMGYDYHFDKDYSVKGWFKRKEYHDYSLRKSIEEKKLFSYDMIFNEWFERYKSRFSKEEYGEKGYGEDVTPQTKITVICGIEDNSIPYWLQQYIEDSLHGLRYHLG